MTGKELRRRRKALGWTQEHLARELEITRATLSAWEGRGEESVPRTASLSIEALSRLPDTRTWADDGIDPLRVVS